MADVRAARIKLYGLVTARWVLIGVILLIEGLDAIRGARGWHSLAWRPEATHVSAYVGVAMAWAAANMVTMRRLQSATDIGPMWAGVHLLVDVVAITGLLALSGGKANPFTIVYFVPITLATQLSPRWTWAVGIGSLLGFAALFAADPIMGGAAGHRQLSGHLRGMWFAFGVTGALVTYFVHHIATGLARQRDELARLRDRAMADRHLAQVGSLAAGAAHELGTPLATLNVLASELDRMAPDELAETSDTMVAEIKRCKQIVQRMAAPEMRAGSMTSMDVAPWPLSRLASGLGDDMRGISYEVADDSARISVAPCSVIAQTLRELITNARHASAGRDATPTIHIRASTADDQVVITVADTGPGMSDEVAEAAFDPFFSTKPEGHGTGMGLYLARALLRQLGGDIDLATTLGRGTEITIRFPMHPLGTRDHDHAD